MFAAKITAMSKTLAPPLDRVYLPTFSMLLLFTSTYATEVGPCFAAAGAAGAAAAPFVAVAPRARAAMADSASAAVRTLLRTGVNIVGRSPIAWTDARPAGERRVSPPPLPFPYGNPRNPAETLPDSTHIAPQPSIRAGELLGKRAARA